MMDKHMPRCFKGNISTEVCVNKNCFETNPFICVYCDHETCKKMHLKCQTIKWNAMKKKMEEHIKIKGTKLLAFVEKMEALFKTSKEIIQTSYKQYKDWVKQLGVTQQKKRCYQKFSQKRWNDLNGNIMAELFNPSQIEYQYVKIVNEKYLQEKRTEFLIKMEMIRKEIPKIYNSCIKEEKRLKKKKKIQHNIFKSKQRTVLPQKQPVILQFQNIELRLSIQQLKRNPIRPDELIIKANSVYISKIIKQMQTNFTYSKSTLQNSFLKKFTNPIQFKISTIFKLYLKTLDLVYNKCGIQLVVYLFIIYLVQRFIHDLQGVLTQSILLYLHWFIQGLFTFYLVFEQFATLISQDKFSNLSLIAFYWSWEITQSQGLSSLSISLSNLLKLEHIYIFTPFDCDIKKCFKNLWNKVTVFKQDWIST